MARPPKNQKRPSAVERMESAFWYTLEQKPFSKITVSDIVKKAEVNRNAFYYHHENINDLAYKSVKSLLVEDGSFIVTQIIETNGAYLNEILDNQRRRELLKRVRLIASSHSSPELTDMLKQALIDAWITSFEVDSAKLDDTARVVITFAVGGLVEVLGKWQIGEEGITPQALVKSGMATTVAKLVGQALSPAAQDKESLEELFEIPSTVDQNSGEQTNAATKTDESKQQELKNSKSKQYPDHRLSL